jgi:metal-sulfur cluster biosynthetic enzyme
VTGAEALRRLAMVIDPELGLDIVELGLVYGLRATPERVEVDLTLTTPSCPLHDAIVGGVQRALDIPGGPEVRVNLVWDPPWTPERIGRPGLEALGAPGAR